MTVADNPKWKDACAAVSEIALLYTALDHQLNHIIIAVMHLVPSPMLEPVVATLDARQKVEMLKAHAKHARAKDWKKALLTHADRLERVARMRNAACHTSLIPRTDGKGFEFAAAAASKMLKSLAIADRSNFTTNRLTLEQVIETIPVAEKALGDGQNILSNFSKVNAALPRAAQPT